MLKYISRDGLCSGNRESVEGWDSACYSNDVERYKTIETLRGLGVVGGKGISYFSNFSKDVFLGDPTGWYFKDKQVFEVGDIVYLGNFCVDYTRDIYNICNYLTITEVLDIKEDYYKPIFKYKTLSIDSNVIRKHCDFSLAKIINYIKSYNRALVIEVDDKAI